MDRLVDNPGKTSTSSKETRMIATNHHTKTKHAPNKNPEKTGIPVAPVARQCDNSTGNKNGPEPVREHHERDLATSIDHFHTDKEGLTAMLPENSDWIQTKNVAITFLEFAARDHKYAEHVLANAQKMRVYYATKAKQQGLTNKAIGEIYGITESAVRAMLKNAGEQ